jgi:hypothetical protein
MSENIESSLPSHVPSRAIVEVSENMRAKIYGLFCKLGNPKEFSNIVIKNTQTYLILQKDLLIYLESLMKIN